MPEDENEIIRRRTILVDKPVSKDEFAGGGHERTANALARSIVQFHGEDKAIGLEGSWGSGKSTIVRLAEKALAASSKKHSYRVFTFDLWANQTGHFKRAFLEAFLDWGKINFSNCAPFIEKKQQEVGDRKQTVKTNSYRDFDWFGLVVVVFLFFSPVIYAWLAQVHSLTSRANHQSSLAPSSHGWR